MKTNEEKLKGLVVDCLPNLFYKVELEDGKIIRAYMAGKMKLNRIRVIVGDKVEVVVPEKGEIYRLVYRFQFLTFLMA